MVKPKDVLNISEQREVNYRKLRVLAILKIVTKRDRHVPLEAAITVAVEAEKFLSSEVA